MQNSESKWAPDHLGEASQEPGSDSLVDITLIEETLRMTPEERLLLNDRMIRTLAELRNGFRQE